MPKLLGFLSLTELCLSSIVHLLFGLYIFSTAVAWDLSQALNSSFREDVDERKPSMEAALDGSVPPIVLVHGIFGFGKGRLGGLSYFAGAEKKDEHVLVPDLGSLTSIHDRHFFLSFPGTVPVGSHDMPGIRRLSRKLYALCVILKFRMHYRARELFYYLKGGQVDYGEEHSKKYGHSQFGKIYEQGNYAIWDDDHPIHFVGHSAGAQVIRALQQMLADKAFQGYESTSEDWILSVTSLSGALNGTTRTYFDGMQPDNWMLMKPICLLQISRVGVIIYDWLNIAWLKNYYNFGFDHFKMEWRKTGVLGLADLLLGNSGPFAAGDWILPDLTIEGASKQNSTLRTFPNTYYFSYATKMTKKFMGITVPSSIFGIHPLLFIRVLQMTMWRHPADLPLPYKGYRDEDWEDNDGALNTISMTHPRFPVEHPSHLVVDDSECYPLQPGIWYYKIIEADHIFFIINRERAGVQFDLLYDGIFQRCRKHAFRTAPPPILPNQHS